MKKLFLRFVVPLLSILFIAILVILLLPVSTEIYTDTSGISNVIGSLQPRVIELDNISIKAQPDSTSCGITTVTIMSNYFNHTDYEAVDLIEIYKTKGNSDADMMKCLQAELPGRTITLKSGGTDEEMIRDIHASLNNGNPVAISSFAAPNPNNEPYYDSHASVVYGINLDSETITIANAYGYVEEISLLEFLNRMSFTERDKFPFIQQFIWKVIPPDKNAYVLVE